MAYSPEFIKNMINSNQLHFGHLKSKAAEPVTPPVWLANFNDGRAGAGPVYLVGRLGKKPVYRTTNAVAHRKNKSFIVRTLESATFITDLKRTGQCKIYWPPIFTELWIPQCDIAQTDIGISGVVSESNAHFSS